MSQPWLILDSHFLCHRAFHTTQDLSWQQKPTGVVFGFLKSISFLKDEFQTDRVVFCFECRKLHRRALFPDYKRHRGNRERSQEEQHAYGQLQIQITQLEKQYLPTIGFKNIFNYFGMESDDIMARIAADLSEQEEAILITADTDLYQCLRPNVSMYSPIKRRLLTDQWFRKEYGIAPSKWALVKAIAGCSSDGVRGLSGIGEKTALKYLRGELSAGSHAYRTIITGKKTVRFNRRLVQLPFVGCPSPNLLQDAISEQGWRSVGAGLGMRSIASHPPIATRKKGLHGQGCLFRA